jgi:CheY-like chemotaxis protein
MEGRSPLQASVIIKESAKLLRASIPATIDIRTAIDDETGMVMSTPTHLSQLLMNLCTNAAQAMSDSGGVLRIGLARAMLDAAGAAAYADLVPGPYLRLTVSDTGPGIDPKIIGRIFEPFFTTKEVGKGTGMGLAVAHGIVKSHDGAITVSSEPGAGTTFTVLLPRLEQGAGAGAYEEQQLPRGTERILFVDDEKLIVQVGRQLLESLGYAVTSCESSLEAVELFRKTPGAFDLVITDQTMPHIAGHQLIGMLLEIRPDIPVVLATGYSEKVTEENALALGFRAYIMKPLNRRELAATIRSVLDGPR